MAHSASMEQSSWDHRDLLDIVDRLRSQGLSRFSLGKSSALEAISGMSFPAKDNLCTRFATELILRRALTADVDIRITPGLKRSDEEKARLGDFTYSSTLADLDIGHVIDDAKSAMDLNISNKVFSIDDQSDEDTALIKALMLLYIKKLRTIILMVVTRYVKALNPKGTCTLGFIIKLNTLD
ncbi:hypothetical protein QBC46DRAFT_365719 [Diplogelasinospora grovesii]|uniref:Uncharacterized protein n=1 Tax=Diplogelasinospora grovesii TaxID=303347 RepID=A0AAN6N473_9PEZI|nr:hypothetical protein QBC46DRAFT_365719 [Diplogelasinospora grovesii]